MRWTRVHCIRLIWGRTSVYFRMKQTAEQRIKMAAIEAISQMNAIFRENAMSVVVSGRTVVPMYGL